MKNGKEVNRKEKSVNDSANSHYVGFSKKSLEHFKRIHSRGQEVKKSK